LASRLLADHHIDLTFDGRTGSVAQLLSVFPDDVIGSDAELAVAYATVRLLDGSLERSAAYLDLARQRADTVAPERRPTFDLLLAEVSLGLARWRGDLHAVLETRPLVEAALAAQPPGERTLSEEIRSVALLNLGIAELWSARLDDARRDLEQALALARRTGRPWLEIACLGHLSIAGPLTGPLCLAGSNLARRRWRSPTTTGGARIRSSFPAWPPARWRCCGLDDSMIPSAGSTERSARYSRTVSPAPS
jgi:LuxR family maltose regulon positive regulatory protein